VFAKWRDLLVITTLTRAMGRFFSYCRRTRMRTKLLLDAQDGRGAIRGTRASKTTSRGKRLQVDHCHASNTPRELLYNSCNIGLGASKGDPARLRKAIECLAKWHQISIAEKHL
jgi:hypothetical protein